MTPKQAKQITEWSGSLMGHVDYVTYSYLQMMVAGLGDEYAELREAIKRVLELWPANGEQK